MGWLQSKRTGYTLLVPLPQIPRTGCDQTGEQEALRARTYCRADSTSAGWLRCFVFPLPSVQCNVWIANLQPRDGSETM